MILINWCRLSICHIDAVLKLILINMLETDDCIECFQEQNGIINYLKIEFVVNITIIYTLLGSVRWKLFSAVGDIQHVRVKRCPFCRNLIEKHTGCNYMFCICGNAFCWDCLQDYNKHDYSKCRINQAKLQVRFVV